MSLAQISYLNIDGDIPVDLAEESFISINRKTPLKIYSLGFQPAKTIPEIPRWFLQKYANPSFTVLEPFAGSGTTIIESLIYRASVYWLDYHPLSKLVCRVKTTRFLPSEIHKEAEKIIRKARKQKEAPETIKFTNKDFWFQKAVQDGLEILREYILEASLSTQSILWLAFATTVRKTSNMNDGMLLAAKRQHIKKIPEFSRSDVFDYYQIYVGKAIEAIVEWNEFIGDAIKNAKELPLEDARNLKGSWSCDAIITSPPYINAIDYVWAAKFELHWLGLIQNDTDRLNLYSKEIGTERILKDEYNELGKTGNSELDKLIEDIYIGKYYKATADQNKLRARVVYKYFIDMLDHFASIYDHLRTGGYYCFSIGDISKICGVNIPVASILSDLAYDVGFREQFRFYLLLKNRKLNVPRSPIWAGTIKHDTIIVLEKI
ncbi:TPA: DNA methylase [bacterium]|nr:DNA methylase [bacterium]